MPLLDIFQTPDQRLDPTGRGHGNTNGSIRRVYTRNPDDVVGKALNYVFSKDRDFQEFLKTSLAGQVAPSLRIRKAAVADAAESPERKTAGGVESVGPVRGQKA